MTAITNQKFAAQHKIVELLKQHLEQHPDRGVPIAIVIASQYANELTLKKLLEWQAQLEKIVADKPMNL